MAASPSSTSANPGSTLVPPGAYAAEDLADGLDGLEVGLDRELDPGPLAGRAVVDGERRVLGTRLVLGDVGSTPTSAELVADAVDDPGVAVADRLAGRLRVRLERLALLLAELARAR